MAMKNTIFTQPYYLWTKPSCSMLLITLLTILYHPTYSVLDHPYHIQTDQGQSRFFQFSSGAGGQYRQETRLPNGTVVGSYSWKDEKGRTRLYMYMADMAGFRVLEKDIMLEDNSIDEDTDHSKIKYDPRKRKLRKHNPLLRGKRKVLVKKVRIPEVIPYQPSLLVSTQTSGRRVERRLVGEMRLLGESNLILFNNTRHKDSPTQTESPGGDDYLPSSVLLQRVKVQSLQEDKSTQQRRGRKHVRRRRPKKNNSKIEVEAQIYFSPH